LFKIALSKIVVPCENNSLMETSLKRATEEALAVFRGMTVGYDQSNTATQLFSSDLDRLKKDKNAQN